MLNALRIFSAAFLLSASIATFSQTQLVPSTGTPLAFEINRGQTASQVQYLARSREGVLFLTANGLTVSVPRQGSFRLLFEKATPSPSIIAEQSLPSRSSYLYHDPDKSISNIENFGSILYRSVYPGIDVRFYARGQHLEHDFLVSSGADPDQIDLRLEGIEKAAITSSGAVELSLGNIKLYESAPVAWQEVKGIHHPIQAQWKLLSSNRLGVSLGQYDHAVPVTIDPVLAYSTHLGGTTEEDFDLNQSGPSNTFIEHIALDGAGNVYVGGSTTAIDFPTTAGAFDRTSNVQTVFHEDSTSQSGFVSKFDKTGRILIYSTYLHANVGEMAVDAAGHVYTAEEADDDAPGPNEGSDTGVFIDKLSTDGSALIFSTIFARSINPPPQCQAFSVSFPTGIAVDNVGHAWVSGNTSNPCLPSTPGVVEPTLAVNTSAGFLAKFNTNVAPAASLIYSTYIGSKSNAFTTALTVDSSGNAYVSGFALATYPHSHSFGTGAEPVSFVTKFNPTATARVFSTLILGISRTIAGIALDSSRNVYIGGSTDATGFPTTPGAIKHTPNGSCNQGVQTVACPDGYVTKLNAAGSALSYSTLLGGAKEDDVNAIQVNSAGMAFVTGRTMSSDFPITPNAFHKTLAPATTDAFVTALNPNGQSLYYSTFLGSSSQTEGDAIFVDPAWNAWVGGFTSAADFPVTANAFQPGRKGAGDGFISKIVIAGDLRAIMTANTTAAARNSTVTFFAQVTNLGPDGSDNVVLLDPIPAGYSFVKFFTNSASSCTVPPVGATAGTVNCKRTRLEKGQTMFVNISLKAIGASGSTHANKITTSARTQDLVPTNNSATVNVSVK